DRVLLDDPTPPDPGNGRVAVLDLRGDGEREPLSLRDVNPDPVRPTQSLPLKTGELGATREVGAGLWRLEPPGEVIDLAQGQRVTLVLLGGDRPPLQLIETRRRPIKDGVAMARLLDLRTSGPTLNIGGEANTRPGEFTGYHPIPGRPPGAILGMGLAERLHVSVGDEVSLVTPLRGVDNKMLGPYGMTPTSARVRVAGLFQSGFHEYDVRLALMNIDSSQRILNRGKVIRWIEVRAQDLMGVETMKRQIAARIDPFDMELLAAQTNSLEGKLTRYLSGDVRQARAEGDDSFIGGIRDAVGLINLLKYQEVDLGYRPGYRLIDWREMNTNLFSALKLQKVVLTIFFLIIIIVGSFVVVGSQIMVIHEKTADIAILRAMGATAGSIRAIFTLQGLLVAGIGTVAGMLGGLAICGLIAGLDYQLDASVYLIDKLPIQLSGWDLVLVATATAACTLAATQYSARRAAAKTPVQGLRTMD
ncbi:MAG: FtsX-like permease family protein, partial [Myxococcota bacterium]|nr:FtsX-like permease family protein [Myxococcota bacterium]